MTVVSASLYVGWLWRKTQNTFSNATVEEEKCHIKNPKKIFSARVGVGEEVLCGANDLIW